MKEKTELNVLWGIAAFPEEALTFEDLMMKARQRLALGEPVETVTQSENAKEEISNV